MMIKIAGKKHLLSKIHKHASKTFIGLPNLHSHAILQFVIKKMSKVFMHKKNLITQKYIL